MKAFLKIAAIVLLAAAPEGCCKDKTGGTETAAPAVPSGAALKSRTATTLTFGWDETDGALTYTYKYKDAAGTFFISATTADRVVTLSSLVEGREYLFAVRADGAKNSSDYTEWISATTGTDQTDPDPEAPDFGFPANENDGLTRAFPGAEGGGMFCTGGRGGTVCHVTNLNDSGAGSFREAVKASGARTIVFDVAGRIELLSDLQIKNGNLTIAGQTAPGDGICISGGTVNIAASNVIIRYMRFRLGDLNTGGNLSDGSDTVWGRYNSDIILDHCSMSWSIDECASFYANKNFTMQWCLLTESLRNSAHGKGSHGYGGIWGGRNASFHHNMLSNHDSRNPRFDHPGIYSSTYPVASYRGNVDYRNNVVYNWGSNNTYGGEDGAFNMVCNYYKPGPASSTRNYFIDAYWYNSSSNVGSAYPKLYMQGNYHAGSYASAINGDNWSGVYFHDQSSSTLSNPSTAAAKLTAPLPIVTEQGAQCYVTTHSAEAAYAKVLSWAGSSLRRDAVDARAASDAASGTATFPNGGNGSTGGLIDSQSAVGGWPSYSATAEELTKTIDSDGDGMPDWWEEFAGLSKNDRNDGNTATLDPTGRYTNLEVYLSWLVKDITAAERTEGAYAALQ